MTSGNRCCQTEAKKPGVGMKEHRTRDAVVGQRIKVNV